MNSLQELLGIMKSLRDPISGCPWDLEQNFHSIAPYTLEEAYEVVDAIRRNDMQDLKQELGDLLFQVVFHAQMAFEAGEFQFDDVVQVINEKLIRRHPHVFAGEHIETPEAQTIAWEKHKAYERQQRSKRNNEHASIMDDVAVTLPGLTRAIKLQQRAAGVGFDWSSVAPVVDKVKEELAELEYELSVKNNAEKIEAELGDLLFSVANLARHAYVDPESALRKSNQKFIRRFKKIESHFDEQKKSIKNSTLDELEMVYQKIKHEEANEK